MPNMTTEKLIEALQQYPKDMQVFISNDPEGNAILKIDIVECGEFQKSNGVGSYDALVIVPTNEEVQEYDGSDEE